MNMKKIVRITTVPISLAVLLKGQLKFMSKYYNLIGVSSPGKQFDDALAQENISGYSISMTRKLTPFKDLVSLVKMVSLLRREKPFIVHTHTPKAGIIGMLAAKIAGVPHRLHTVAGMPLLEATGKKRTLLDAVEKLTYACATRVYPNSKVMEQIILDGKYTSKDKLQVIGNGSSNGIDTSFFSREHIVRSSSEIIDDLCLKNAFTFCFVGRLVGDKGINELVNAFNRLQQEYTDVRLLLVGGFEAELDPLHKRTIEVIDNSDNIIAVGHQKDVRPYLAVSNVFTFGSYREGFPNVVMQAGAMDLPCIVTDINGCNEIIIEGKNGLIVPPKNSDALYEAMKKLYLDKSLREEMATCARELIVSRYEQKMVWEALLAEYKSLEK